MSDFAGGIKAAIAIVHGAKAVSVEAKLSHIPVTDLDRIVDLLKARADQEVTQKVHIPPQCPSCGGPVRLSCRCGWSASAP